MAASNVESTETAMQSFTSSDAEALVRTAIDSENQGERRACIRWMMRATAIS